jgi:uncharacterized membrane protein
MATPQLFFENPTLTYGMAIAIAFLVGVLTAGAKYVTGRLEKVIERIPMHTTKASKATTLLCAQLMSCGW